MKKLLLMVLMSVTALTINAQASTQVYNGSTGWYSAGQTLNHTFNRPVYVERLVISAVGSSRFTMAQVYADGDLVSNMGIPGNDPDYPVVIRKKVSSLMVKFQGSVNILDFKIYADENGRDRDADESVEVLGSDSVAQLAGKASEVVEFLQTRLSTTDFNTYLKPIRKSALLLEAAATGRNSTSEFTRQKAVQLITAIKRAECLIDRLMDSNYYTRSALSLMTIKEALERKYDIEVVRVSEVPTNFVK